MPWDFNIPKMFKRILYLYLFIVLGPTKEPKLSSTGVCNSWNGKECSDKDSVNAGRGPGSCNSNFGCPCCAPFCSNEGYCQTTDVGSILGTAYYQSYILC